jgi:hypothetical protein
LVTDPGFWDEDHQTLDPSDAVSLLAYLFNGDFVLLPDIDR